MSHAASTPLAAALVGLLAWGAAQAEAAPDDGRAVMQRVDERPRGADEVMRASWRLIPSSGRERVRATRSYWRDHRTQDDGLHSKRLIVFEAPPPVKDTAFLVFSRLGSDEDDLRWIYLPALRKVRRIAGGDRGKSFVGTDFSYEDLSERDVDEDDHVLLRTLEVDGVLHYVVESTPRNESAYARRVQFVNGESYTVSRVEYFDRGGRLEKVLTARWRQVDGIWSWERLEMENLRRKHRTRVEVGEVRHDVGLADDVFSQNALRLGVP